MKFQIPLFKLNYDAAEKKAVSDCLDSQWISMGPRGVQFEEKFAKMLDVEHAVSLSNCTVALHLALRLLEVGPGDEVICPSLTFVATVNCIRYVGGVPVFADVVGPENPTLDPKSIEAMITPKTKAIIVMHFGGYGCDMDKIMDIANRHGLKVVEDACHAPFSEFQGRKLGGIGDIGCYSFFSNKNLSTGEGGMLVTRNEDLAARAKLLRSHGMTSMSYQRAGGHATRYDVVEFGYNYRMDDIRAALGLCQLEKIPDDYDQRARVRAAYLEAFSDVEEVVIPFQLRTDYSSNYIFPIVLKSGGEFYRDKVREKLASKGIQTSVHYPSAHRFETYKGNADLPQTEFISDHLITLPMYAALSNEEVALVVDSLKEALE